MTSFSYCDPLLWMQGSIQMFQRLSGLIEVLQNSSRQILHLSFLLQEEINCKFIPLSSSTEGGNQLTYSIISRG